MRTRVKPFLKWAGGKRQLIGQLERHFPPELKDSEIKRYVEPFIGGGALFFHIAQTYNVDEFFISDINAQLILAYQVVQKEVETLIGFLDELKNKYMEGKAEEREELFYKIRAEFNASGEDVDLTVIEANSIKRTAQFIFLNRTCFNGLYRVNSSGGFNVPFGRYKKPKLCDKKNLRAVSTLIQDVEIKPGDFTLCRKFVDANTFVYFDPPYRPISKTSSFTSYSKAGFNDDDQAKLADFYRALHQKGAKLMLSNSDPKSSEPTDDFFDDLYQGFTIQRKVQSKRMINRNGNGRGDVTELLVMNYESANSS
jgi:DNA adenine methylase